MLRRPMSASHVLFRIANSPPRCINSPEHTFHSRNCGKTCNDLCQGCRRPFGSHGSFFHRSDSSLGERQMATRAKSCSEIETLRAHSFPCGARRKVVPLLKKDSLSSTYHMCYL
ncbi:hypothetical protein CEXT_297381 [Caerostris extrusa]|uniref:C2H2-type domain-containing protein n=1 Tax=Caerostris extrusa TaxID=172846 RepID=A0AAV4MJB2_CAEEX|nr:hypothetical protein CEXT_297381 [Caerostris extrusa]